MNRRGFAAATLLIWVGCLLVAGCSRDPSRPPIQAEQEQIRKDADATFDRLQEEERKAGKGPE